MFIINLTYKAPLKKIDQFLEAHIQFLNKQYTDGFFLTSGRKEPRNGGIILCKAENKDKVEQIIKLDPFKINNLAEYEVIEFIPTKTNEELTFLIEH